jgi:glycerophosphoryl diester phosphodiesterase
MFLVSFLLLFSPLAKCDSTLSVEFARLISRYVVVAPESLVWTHKADKYVVQTLDGDIAATIFEPTARVLEVYKSKKRIYAWPGITVVGHRATMLFAPENTLAAIRRAAELGVNIMEMDVRQTKDGEFIIMHDETVDRTTTGHGRVDELTLSEIKQLDAGVKYAKEFAGEKVPTLREVLRAVHDKGSIDIDFKTGNLNHLRTLLEDEGFGENLPKTFLGDFNQMKEVSQWIDLWIRPSSPMAKVGLTKVVQKLNPPIINVAEIQFSKSYLKEIHRHGRKSFVNVILNRPLEESRLKRVVEGLPDYIQTDRPDFLVPHLRKLGLQAQKIPTENH